MLAEDLRLAVTLQPFGTGVPTRHDAVRVEHVDGIVGHCLNQQFQATAFISRKICRVSVRQPLLPNFYTLVLSAAGTAAIYATVAYGQWELKDRGLCFRIRSGATTSALRRSPRLPLRMAPNRPPISDAPESAR